MRSAPGRSFSLHAFTSRAAMADALADEVMAALSVGIAERGAASLAASGGETPVALYDRLTRGLLDWSAVTVTLADERWVPPDSEGSNEALVRRALLQDAARDARLIGLYVDGAESPSQAARLLEARLADVPWPFDAVVLGMGVDGHVASWFPRAEGLGEVLTTREKVAMITALPSPVVGPYRRRATLTRAAFLGARVLTLMIVGGDKRAALDVALEPGPVEDMPVRALLEDPGLRLQIFWAP